MNFSWKLQKGTKILLMFTSVTNQNAYQGPYHPSQNILRPVTKSGKIYRQSSSRIVFDPLPLQAMLLRSCYCNGLCTHDLQLFNQISTISPNCLEGGGGAKRTVEI